MNIYSFLFLDKSTCHNPNCHRTDPYWINVNNEYELSRDIFLMYKCLYIHLVFRQIPFHYLSFQVTDSCRQTYLSLSELSGDKPLLDNTLAGYLTSVLPTDERPFILTNLGIITKVSNKLRERF